MFQSCKSKSRIIFQVDIVCVMQAFRYIMIEYSIQIATLLAEILLKNHLVTLLL